MRSAQEMYALILDFAQKDPRVRLVTLEGSRANKNIPPDEFQDYDISFFVTDLPSFTADDCWLEIFGERLILQKPEDMALFPPEEPGFSYLMLFTDGVKMDLTLLPLGLLEEYRGRECLVRVLLDKDGLTEDFPAPTDKPFWIQRPTARVFDDCCNEFWNTTTYVVKGLCRREILFAIDHMQEIQRKELLRMLSWLVGTEYGFSFSLGKNGKFLDQYLPPELWRRLLSTYVMDSYPHMWAALEETMALFREASKETARRLGFAYPTYDQAISGYTARQKAEYFASCF